MNLSEQRTAILDDLSLESTDTFFTTAFLNRAINRAVKWVANRHNWQQTQRAVKRDSVAGQEFYNYPENFKTDSLTILTLDGVRHKKRLFKEYELYKEDNTTGSKEMWADFRRRYFINPTPSADGVKNIKIWGHEIPDELSADTDEHPFNDEETLEEAIHLFALHLCYRKKGGTYRVEATNMRNEAKVMIAEAWDVQLREQSKYQTEQSEMFKQTDFLREGGKTGRGNFRTCSNQ